jgi:hypothetical protein
MAIDAASGLGDAVATLTAKIASVDADKWEAASDAAGYGTTQRSCLDQLSAAYASNDQQTYNYWAQVAASTYMHLDSQSKANYDSGTFTQGNVTTTPAPTFGNAGILNYWADMATEAATGVKRAIVGDDSPDKPESNNMIWWIVGGALGIFLLMKVIR